jgi:hypothetical protein
MGHCIQTDFLKVYLMKGGSVLDEFPNFMLAEEQLRCDNRVMFIAPPVKFKIFRQGQTKKHIRAKEKTQDGMCTWEAIVR